MGEGAGEVNLTEKDYYQDFLRGDGGRRRGILKRQTPKNP